ncbi:hypothetical protein [Acidihalobacter yilgarnensis]|nr:hypothetical protein [Acidihalobacter yilgarnensis]
MRAIDPALRYITEAHTTRNGSYFLVRVPGKPQKTFAYKCKQGRLVALESAKTYRNSLFHDGKAPPQKTKYEASASNTSGYIGLHRALRFKRGAWQVYWVAVFPPSTGQPYNKAFMVGSRTECEAFKLAAAARYERCGDLVQVSRNPNAPCSPGVPVEKRF